MAEFSARDRLRLLAGGGACLLAACGGGGASPAPTATGTTAPAPPPTTSGSTDGNSGTGGTSSEMATGQLRDAFASNFSVGTAVGVSRINPNDQSADIAIDQFNSITPEWSLKANNIAPREGEFNFTEADRIVNWALDNGMRVRGHALLWHESTPDYFLQGTPTQIRARLENYVSTVVDHFRGRVDDWDVANEVVSRDIYRGSDGIGPDRRSGWFNAVGNADYIDWAFQAAREANQNARLFINEDNTGDPMIQGWMIEIVRRLLDRGVPIDGIGHQCHLPLTADVNSVLGAVDAFNREFPNLVTHITEMDINCYNDPGSCWESNTGCQADIGAEAPASLLADHARLVKSVMDGLIARPNVESVTFWGVRDSDSWLNSSPVSRSNHPLLFDRNGEAKPAFFAITDPDYVIEG